jgi:Fe-S cluster assembly protein SufD
MQINNLRLSPQCQVRATPILDTATADCSCSHGATVGDLDRDQLFYLRSRGLDSAAAKITLRGAFEEKILRNFPKASSCNG